MKLVALEPVKRHDGSGRVAAAFAHAAVAQLALVVVALAVGANRRTLGHERRRLGRRARLARLPARTQGLLHDRRLLRELRQAERDVGPRPDRLVSERVRLVHLLLVGAAVAAEQHVPGPIARVHVDLGAPAREDLGHAGLAILVLQTVAELGEVAREQERHAREGPRVRAVPELRIVALGRVEGHELGLVAARGLAGRVARERAGDAGVDHDRVAVGAHDRVAVVRGRQGGVVGVLVHRRVVVHGHHGGVVEALVHRRRAVARLDPRRARVAAVRHGRVPVRVPRELPPREQAVDRVVDALLDAQRRFRHRLPALVRRRRGRGLAKDALFLGEGVGAGLHVLLERRLVELGAALWSLWSLGAGLWSLDAALEEQLELVELGEDALLLLGVLRRVLAGLELDRVPIDVRDGHVGLLEGLELLRDAHVGAPELGC
mmetsp:Transcript_28374/g.93976  ORF Transcript_28374/g.93976 Transcript_28374/m.93976 type:complete len:434 (-) Transcript_28374:394-1695(-)